jgi:phosphopantetheinyl transferase (holo-ACP synthase)
MSREAGVVAEAVAVVTVAETERLLTAGTAPFHAAEIAYARSKSDPARRLAARLAAKRAAAGLLEIEPAEVEVLPARGGPPGLRLSPAGEARLRRRGAARVLVSLTHGRTHAAALVVLVAASGRTNGRWLRRARLALLVAAPLLAGGAGLAYLAYAPAGDLGPHPFNQDRNATWLEHRWLEREHGEAEMEALLSRLSRRGVRYVFPHLIPFNGSGRLPPHSREQMRAFLRAARRVDPALRVLPWVGGLRVGYRRQREGAVDLADLGQRQRIVAECRGLIDEGFDGIHVNVEPVDDGNVDFLALLRSLRTAVGEDHTLSISAIRPGPFALPMAPNFFWTPDYYARLGAVVDQIVLMTYDTALPTPSLYRRYVAYAAASVARRLVASRSRARVLVGVPTYDATGLMHRAGVETPEHAIAGVVAGLRGLGAGGTFEGVALYAEWTTEPEEWALYERLWRGSPLELQLASR